LHLCSREYSLVKATRYPFIGYQEMPEILFFCYS
jgi:hypothetical protein